MRKVTEIDFDVKPTTSEMVDVLARVLTLFDIRRNCLTEKQGIKNKRQLDSTDVEIAAAIKRLEGYRKEPYAKPIGKFEGVVMRGEITRTIDVVFNWKDRLKMFFGGSMKFKYRVYTEGAIGRYAPNEVFTTERFKFKRNEEENA